jgi:hypothetical protein
MSTIEPVVPPGDDSPNQTEPDVLTRCARHPSVETSLRCGRCGTPICPRCLVSTPVGARCPSCAQVKRFATVLKPMEVVRALVLGIAVAMAGTLLAQLIPFISFIALAAVGYVVGEVVSQAVNRKRGTEIGVLAIVCLVLGYLLSPVLRALLGGNVAVLAFLPTIVIAGILATLHQIYSLLALGVAALLAWMRAR